MLVADVLYNLVKKQRLKSVKAQKNSSFGSFQINIDDEDEKVFQGKNTKDGYVNVSIAGTLPSSRSVIARKLSNSPIGYSLGSIAFLGSETPKDQGEDISEIKSFAILSGSALLGHLLGYYVFDDLLGIDVGKINVAIPYFADDESLPDLEKRAKKYAVDSISSIATEENIQVAQSIWKKAQNASITYATISSVENVLNAIHGYKRHNGSIYWALGWLAFGNLGYAISQGYAKPLLSVQTKKQSQTK